VPTNQFIIYDDRTVRVETVSAELTVTQPREVSLYDKAFRALSAAARFGRGARELIQRALTDLDPSTR
jgi:hypothetical protein